MNPRRPPTPNPDPDPDDPARWSAAGRATAAAYLREMAAALATPWRRTANIQEIFTSDIHGPINTRLALNEKAVRVAAWAVNRALAELIGEAPIA